MVRKHLLQEYSPSPQTQEVSHHQAHPDLFSQLPSSPRRADKAPHCCSGSCLPSRAQADLRFLKGRFDSLPPRLFSVPPHQNHGSLPRKEVYLLRVSWAEHFDQVECGSPPKRESKWITQVRRGRQTRTPTTQAPLLLQPLARTFLTQLV